MAAQLKPEKATMTINITVYIDSLGQPYVTDSPYVMPKNEHDKTIHWNIDPAAPQAAVFAADGIVFTPASAQFSDPKLSAHGKQFSWKNQNRDGTAHDYRVTVSGTAPTPQSVDPIIQNDGGEIR